MVNKCITKHLPLKFDELIKITLPQKEISDIA